MKHLADDIANLFESQGQGTHGYRELARENEAKDARQRWPLFRSIEPLREEPPVALSSQVRSQLWHTPSPVVSVSRIRQVPQYGGKSLLNGLRQLAGISGKEVPVVACLERSIQPVGRPATWPSNASPASTVALAVPAPERMRLFSQETFADSARPEHHQGGDGHNSLSQVFSRIAGIHEPVQEPIALTAQKPAPFLARFGRR